MFLRVMLDGSPLAKWVAVDIHVEVLDMNVLRYATDVSRKLEATEERFRVVEFKTSPRLLAIDIVGADTLMYPISRSMPLKKRLPNIVGNCKSLS